MRKMVLLEDRADGVVHRLRGPGVLADRLFQHHARLPADQALPCRGLADRPEQLGGDGQVEQADEGIGVAEVALPFRPAFVAGPVPRAVAPAPEEAVDARRIAPARSARTPESNGRATGGE